MGGTRLHISAASSTYAINCLGTGVAATDSGCLTGRTLPIRGSARNFAILEIQREVFRTQPRSASSCPALGPIRRRRHTPKEPSPGLWCSDKTTACSAAATHVLDRASSRPIRCNSLRTRPPQPCSFDGYTTSTTCHRSRFVTKQWPPPIDGARFSPRPWPALRPVWTPSSPTRAGCKRRMASQWPNQRRPLHRPPNRVLVCLAGPRNAGGITVPDSSRCSAFENRLDPHQ